MGQAQSEFERNQCKCCQKGIEETTKSEPNYLVNKHPPVKRPKIDDVMPPCTVCKQRKIIEELPKQKVKMTLEQMAIRNRWDEMGNDSRTKMPWKATCY